MTDYEVLQAIVVFSTFIAMLTVGSFAFYLAQLRKLKPAKVKSQYDPRRDRAYEEDHR